MTNPALKVAASTEFKIDSDIPLPGSRGGGKRKYPFLEMKVGDSFVAPAGTDRDSFRSTASYFGSRHSCKFSVRKTADGLRCWRIA